MDYKKILDHMNVAVLLFGPDLRLEYINTAGEVLFADSSRHLTGRNADEIFPPGDNAVSGQIKQCVLTHDTLLGREIRMDWPHAALMVNFSATPLFEHNRLVGIIVEIQPADSYLRTSKEEKLLAQHNTHRMLIRGLAHEIKNPLGGLRGAAQLLELELDDPELKEYTQIIIAESDRLQALMDRMLGPNTPPQKQECNIHEVLERVRQLVQAEITGYAIEIRRDYDPSIPTLDADRNLLIQALLNIARNAAQAITARGPQGEITLRTRVLSQTLLARKRYKLICKIDVIDNGPGIPPDLIERIFCPMITGRPEGTGLGLSIAQSIIHQHHGLIECESQPGHTVFSIFLPLEHDHG